MRVHIIGGAGSGKSYLARRLAGLYDLEVLHLDYLFWDAASGRWGTRREADERSRMLDEFLKKDSWVIEGVYHSWLAPSFIAADVVVILLPPLWLRHYRTIRRFVRRKIGLDHSQCSETLKNMADLLRWNQAYDRDNLVRTREYLAEFGVQPMECRSADKALEAIMASTRRRG